jgi:hypothetical protein
MAEEAKARQSSAAEIVQELLGLFGGDFQRTRKPAAERSIQKGITDKEHENGRNQRDGDGAENHLGFEAGAELCLVPLHE